MYELKDSWVCQDTLTQFILENPKDIKTEHLRTLTTSLATFTKLIDVRFIGMCSLDGIMKAKSSNESRVGYTGGLFSSIANKIA